MRTFDRGDIVWIDFEPSVGTEQKGTRPALVLSPKEVNRMVGHFICVPISQGANLNRTLGFTVSLIGTGLKTQGVVISDQIKAVDPVERNARFIETAPQYIIEEVLGKLAVILGIDV